MITRYLVLQHSSIMKDLATGFFILIAGIGLFQSLLGLFQFIVLDWLSPIAIPVKTVVNGTIGPSNGYGLLIGLGLLSMIYVYREKKDTWPISWLALSLVIMSLAFLLTKSRGAWMSLCIAIAVLILLLKKQVLILYLKKVSQTFKIKKHFNYFFFAAVIILLTIVFCKELFSMNPHSVRGRLYAWEISWEMIADHKFIGVGMGRFAPEFIKYQSRFLSRLANHHLIAKASYLETPHNQYLFELCEKGLIGGVIFLALCTVISCRLVKSLRPEKNRHRTKNSFFLGFFIIIFSHCLVDSSLVVVPIKVIFMISMAFVAAPPLINVTTHSKTRFSIAGFMLMLFMIYITSKTVCSDHRGRAIWMKANYHLTRHDYGQASCDFSRASNYIPDNPVLISYHGISLIGAGEYGLGMQHIKSVIHLYNDKAAWLALSLAEWRSGHYAIAERYANCAHLMYPDQLRPSLMSGIIHLFSGDEIEAEKDLLRCANEATSIHSSITQHIASTSRSIYNTFFVDEENFGVSLLEIKFGPTWFASIDSIMLVAP